MPHDITLIATIALGFVLAFVFGVIANGFRLPPLVGYLIAGVAIGPFTPGFVADAALAGQLAEIGVMLLMFGVGLHFSIPDLLAVRRIAIPGAIAQIGLATALGVVLAMSWGWSFGGALVLGLSLSVASTVVLLKALEERNAVATPNGRIAVGWLIVEDLVMVLALVLLPAFAETLGGHAISGHGDEAAGEGLGLWASLGLTLVKVSAFVGIALYFGPRVMPWLLRQVARTGSRELFTLGVLTIALGIAFGSAKLFGVSFALGAFFAGVVLSESEFSHKAAANSLPLQDAFSVLFFVSVGMLFDPHILVNEPLAVLAVVALILFGKSLAALGIVLVLGYPLSAALTVSAALAQIGEFSFILAGLGAAHGLLPPEGVSLILAGALLSITLNPLMFAGAKLVTTHARRWPRLHHLFETSREPRFGELQAELDAARHALEAKAAAHHSFSPEALVERFPLFKGLSPEQREAFVLYFETREVSPGERVIRVGDKADCVYFISSGEFEVEAAGRKIRLSPGGYFGEMALLQNHPRSADVTALNYGKLLSLTRRDFRDFLRKHPDIHAQITTLAAQRDEMNRQPDSAPPITPASKPTP